MTAKTLAGLKALKLCRAGECVTFRACVLRFWEIGGLRMCLIGDETALTRVELGEATVEQGASYEFRDALVREYPGGWHSASLAEGGEVALLDEDVPISQDEAYIERTYKILSGVQRKKGRREGRVAPWRHPAEEQPE
jgi:hypothetical protein